MTVPTTPAPPRPANPRPAASLILVRDGNEGLEVLLLERPAKASFAPGALVFPGGRVEPTDGALRCLCHDGAGLCETDLAHRAAALRETFEECGLLLAGPSDGAAPAPAGCAFSAMLRQRRLALRTDRLVPFAHWITPAALPKRFDTRFYLAPTPDDQAMRLDAREVVTAAWVRPGEVAALAEDGRAELMFATYMMLRQLARARSAAEALDAARSRPVVAVTPEIVATPDGRAYCIPEGSGYDETAVLERRFRTAARRAP